jgi:hypothetical protein
LPPPLKFDVLYARNNKKTYKTAKKRGVANKKALKYPLNVNKRSKEPVKNQ